MDGSNQRRPYQGYPYVNPPVNDAPSINAATAARWNNLPRKQVVLPVKLTKPKVCVNTPDGDASEDLPWKAEPDPTPVLYIDVPETSESYVSTERRETPADEFQDEFSPREYKHDPVDEPVVYIDMPDTDGSEVARSIQNVEQSEPNYVQETIFFDPFENRRIEMHKNERADSESDDESTVSSQPPRRRPLPPIRPHTLDVYEAGSSGGGSSSGEGRSGMAGLSPLMSKETMLYGQEENIFPMSQFPEPPPAYTEIDRVTSPAVSQPEPTVAQPQQEEPPRTQVILSPEAATTPLAIPNSGRKHLDCHICGMKVHTLVVKDNGTITHAIALCCGFICMLPCIALVYFTDNFKIKNHYCPNCNNVIGYERPFGSGKIIYHN